jgi:hypothetical protein
MDDSQSSEAGSIPARATNSPLSVLYYTMLWFGTFRYALTELDFSPLEECFAHLPSNNERQILATAIEYFLRDEVPPPED